MLAPNTQQEHRVDHLLIAEMVAQGSRVLDVGCGDGALLQLLTDTKEVDGRGMEVSRERVNACVARGLSVIQGDADRDLADYPDGAFDYAILSLTIQATRQPKDGAGAAAAHRPPGDRLVPELRPLAGAGAPAVTRPHAGDGATCRRPGTSPPTRTCAPSRTSPTCARWWTRASSGPWRSTAGVSSSAPGCRSRCTTCWARRPCSC